MKKNYVTVERCGSFVGWISGGSADPCTNEARLTSVNPDTGQASRTCTIHAPVGFLSVSDDKIPDLLGALGRLLDRAGDGDPHREDLRRDLRGIIGKISVGDRADLRPEPPSADLQRPI